jgi:ABC-type polysaccharide/polyol phosphate export permease
LAGHLFPQVKRHAVIFKAKIDPKRGQSAATMFELIFHTAVHNVRIGHQSPIIGLVLSMLQTIMMVAGFYVMFHFAGMRGSAIRGDYILYIFSGIFMFMLHTKAMGAVMKADGPTSNMMKHAPMNTIVAICGSALSALYLQMLALFVVLWFYHSMFNPITIEQPVQVMGMMLTSWGSGAAIGMLFRSASPWNPKLVSVISGLYMRLNMISSGKMFVANTMPSAFVAIFDWNPLFHTIDQGRGFIFLNYNPHYSSITYPIVITLICIVIGLMGEFYTKQYASLSWQQGK